MGKIWQEESSSQFEGTNTTHTHTHEGGAGLFRSGIRVGDKGKDIHSGTIWRTLLDVT